MLPGCGNMHLITAHDGPLHLCYAGGLLLQACKVTGHLRSLLVSISATRCSRCYTEVFHLLHVPYLPLTALYTTLPMHDPSDRQHVQGGVLGCRNYPHDRDVGFGTKLWKTGMDRVYLPFYRSFMIKDQGEAWQSSSPAIARSH